MCKSNRQSLSNGSSHWVAWLTCFSFVIAAVSPSGFAAGRSSGSSSFSSGSSTYRPSSPPTTSAPARSSTPPSTPSYNTIPSGRTSDTSVRPGHSVDETSRWRHQQNPGEATTPSSVMGRVNRRQSDSTITTTSVGVRPNIPTHERTSGFNLSHEVPRSVPVSNYGNRGQIQLPKESVPGKFDVKVAKDPKGNTVHRVEDTDKGTTTNAVVRPDGRSSVVVTDKNGKAIHQHHEDKNGGSKGFDVSGAQRKDWTKNADGSTFEKTTRPGYSQEISYNPKTGEKREVERKDGKVKELQVDRFGTVKTVESDPGSNREVTRIVNPVKGTTINQTKDRQTGLTETTTIDSKTGKVLQSTSVDSRSGIVTSTNIGKNYQSTATHDRSRGVTQKEEIYKGQFSTRNVNTKIDHRDGSTVQVSSKTTAGGRTITRTVHGNTSYVYRQVVTPYPVVVTPYYTYTPGWGLYHPYYGYYYPGYDPFFYLSLHPTYSHLAYLDNYLMYQRMREEREIRAQMAGNSFHEVRPTIINNHYHSSSQAAAADPQNIEKVYEEPQYREMEKLFLISNSLEDAHKFRRGMVFKVDQDYEDVRFSGTDDTDEKTCDIKYGGTLVLNADPLPGEGQFSADTEIVLQYLSPNIDKEGKFKGSSDECHGKEQETIRLDLQVVLDLNRNYLAAARTLNQNRRDQVSAELGGKAFDEKFVPNPDAANKPIIKICGGAPGLIYDQIAELVEAADPDSIEVVNTEGSVMNLNRLKDQGCDVALAQSDVLDLVKLQDLNLVTYKADLYRESAHLVCRADMKVNSIYDLKSLYDKISATREKAESKGDFATLDKPEMALPTVLIGHNYSGSAAMWLRVMALPPDNYLGLSFMPGKKNYRFDKIPYVYGSGIEAIKLAELKKNQCFFQVAGLGSQLLNESFKDGVKFNIVSLESGSFDNQGTNGKAYYQAGVIPKNTYPHLQSGEIKTVMVNAAVIYNEKLKAEPAAKLKVFEEAWQKALPEIQRDVLSKMKQ